MNKELIIPQTKWQQIPQSNKEFVESDTNRAFLAIADSYYSGDLSPEQIVPVGENRLVVACDALRMYCINTITGEMIWKIEVNFGYIEGGDFGQVCYRNGVIYAGLGGAYFTAINPENGEYLWQINCGKKKTSFSSPFLFRDDSVYFNSGDTVFCINLSTRKIVWKTKIAKKESIFRRNPVFWKNYLVYHVSNTDKHFSQEIYADKYKFYFFNIETGEIEMSKDVDNPPRIWNFQSYVTGDTLWYESENNNLYSYNLEKGEEQKIDLGDFSSWDSCFILDKDKIYTCFGLKGDKGIYCYDILQQKFELVISQEEFNDSLTNITWIKIGEYLYGYCRRASDGSSEYIYRLSLVDYSLEKFRGIPPTEDDDIGEIFSGIEGFTVANGICYLSSIFDGNANEDGRTCLWAFW